MGYAVPALGAVEYDDEGNAFDVIAYRGAVVLSRGAWTADVQSRGGVVTQVPGGFFHGIMAGRFGAAVPYVYELPPVWLLVSDGIDAGTYELLNVLDYTGIAESAENQWNQLKDAAGNAGKVPDLVKWAAVAVCGVVALEVLRMLPGARGG